MALTTYLTQSIVCTLLFYSYGLGWYGSVGFTGMFLITLILFACQMAASVWWLTRFRYGPAEWLWRTLTYGRAPSIVLVSAALAFAAPLSGQQMDSVHAVELPRSREHAFQSRINGGDYLLWIALPRNYFTPGDTARYAVVYLLDGRIELPAAATAYTAGVLANSRGRRIGFTALASDHEGENLSDPPSGQRGLPFGVLPRR
jgi:hypothetical protein